MGQCFLLKKNAIWIPRRILISNGDNDPTKQSTILCIDRGAVTNVNLSSRLSARSLHSVGWWRSTQGFAMVAGVTVATGPVLLVD